MNRKIWLLAFAAALASCGGSAITTRGSMGNKGAGGSHVTAAAASPGLPVIVKNEPYLNDPNGAAVVAAMTGLPRYLPVRWIPATGAPTGYYVVLAFGERPVGNTDYCETPGLTPRPASTATAIFATFCYDKDMLSDAQVNAGPVTGPGDPQFRDIMAALVQTLMPTNTSYNRSGAD